MAIAPLERYKLIFEEHRFASEFRLKILQGWCWVYAGFAAIFSWVESKSSAYLWIVPSAAIGATILLWMADYRMRSAVAGSKKIGRRIEESNDGGIPEDQRYFCSLAPMLDADKWFTHTNVIDVFACIAIWLLTTGSLCLVRWELFWKIIAWFVSAGLTFSTWCWIHKQEKLRNEKATDPA